MPLNDLPPPDGILLAAVAGGAVWYDPADGAAVVRGAAVADVRIPAALLCTAADCIDRRLRDAGEAILRAQRRAAPADSTSALLLILFDTDGPDGVPAMAEAMAGCLDRTRPMADVTVYAAVGRVVDAVMDAYERAR